MSKPFSLSRESMHAELARRAGLALGLAYAMRDRGERRRLVVAQLREARALDILSKGADRGIFNDGEETNA